MDGIADTTSVQAPAHPSLGTYQDHNEYRIKREDWETRVITGRKQPAGVAINLLVCDENGGTEKRVIDVNDIDNPGIRAKCFVCPLDTCARKFARRHTVSRHFFDDHIRNKHEMPEGLQWYDHATVSTYCKYKGWAHKLTDEDIAQIVDGDGEGDDNDNAGEGPSTGPKKKKRKSQAKRTEHTTSERATEVSKKPRVDAAQSTTRPKPSLPVVVGWPNTPAAIGYFTPSEVHIADWSCYYTLENFPSMLCRPHESDGAQLAPPGMFGPNGYTRTVAVHNNCNNANLNHSFGTGYQATDGSVTSQNTIRHSDDGASLGHNQHTLQTVGNSTSSQASGNLTVPQTFDSFQISNNVANSIRTAPDTGLDTEFGSASREQVDPEHRSTQRTPDSAEISPHIRAMFERHYPADVDEQARSLSPAHHSQTTPAGHSAQLTPSTPSFNVEYASEGTEEFIIPSLRAEDTPERHRSVAPSMSDAKCS